MASATKRIPAIIKKLDAAVEALAELQDIVPENERGQKVDGIYLLKSQINEFSDYLEKATWWKKG